MPNTIYHSYSPYAAQVLPTMDFMPNPPPTIMEAERAILQDLAGEGGQITTGRMKKGSGGLLRADAIARRIAASIVVVISEYDGYISAGQAGEVEAALAANISILVLRRHYTTNHEGYNTLARVTGVSVTNETPLQDLNYAVLVTDGGEVPTTEIKNITEMLA